MAALRTAIEKGRAAEFAAQFAEAESRAPEECQ
jgi:queuine/archaeosine tRNA-ribosyltransferase